MRAAIRERALALGFDAVGFAPAHGHAEQAAHLRAFLARGYHGDMGWMASRADERARPNALWPEAKSAVVLGLNYGPAHDPLAVLEQRAQGAISVYAQGDDYHDVMKPKLKTLARFMAARFQAGVKIFVDTAPLMEKPLAARAEIGWQGKHTNLVSRGLGSWLFLGAVLTTLDLEPDTPHADHCGACRRCLDACPTAAFPHPYQIDARRCISYLTIEHKGPIPRDLRPLMGNRIYGCDDCLAVCPWNKFAASANEIKLHARPALTAPSLEMLAALDDAQFRTLFAKSPVKRIGRARFLRNVLIAIGNSGEARLVRSAQALLSDTDALVRGAAIWALSRLLPRDAFEGLRLQTAPDETDASVLAEWDGAIAPGAGPGPSRS